VKCRILLNISLHRGCYHLRNGKVVILTDLLPKLSEVNNLDFLNKLCMGEAPYQSPELEHNKQLVRNFIEDVLTRHNIGAADNYFFAQKSIKHNTKVLGTEGFKEARRRFFQEFPDSRTTQ
jgi:carboxypeptidase C (cathepsin A)